MWRYPDVSVNHFSQVHAGDKLLSEIIAAELEKVLTAVQKYIYLGRTNEWEIVVSFTPY